MFYHLRNSAFSLDHNIGMRLNLLTDASPPVRRLILPQLQFLLRAVLDNIHYTYYQHFNFQFEMALPIFLYLPSFLLFPCLSIIVNLLIFWFHVRLNNYLPNSVYVYQDWYYATLELILLVCDTAIQNSFHSLLFFTLKPSSNFLMVTFHK